MTACFVASNYCRRKKVVVTILAVSSKGMAAKTSTFAETFGPHLKTENVILHSISSKIAH